jgi:Transposase DDE domain
MENAAQENWQTLLSLFPPLWRERAGESGAVERLRGFSSAEALLRTLLLHIANGFSLRETAVQAKLAQLAKVSDVALLKRLRNSEEWLRLLCVDLLRENGMALATAASSRRLRIVDGTLVKEPGKTGSQWRILYSLQLPALSCDFFEISATAGEGTGESFRRLPIEPQELVLGDAGYWSTEGIAFVRKQRADVLVRVNPQNFTAYGPQGRRVQLLRRLRTIRQSGQMGEWKVVLRAENVSVQGRVCAIRKSELAIQQAHRRLHRRASKMQTTPKPQTLEYAKYVIVFTTLATESAGQVLECYRLRWQIELAFKRMKTLAQLGHLPKHDDRSARAWLYGKLLVALLTQKLIRVGRDISPWGYSLPMASSDKPLA